MHPSVTAAKEKASSRSSGTAVKGGSEPQHPGTTMRLEVWKSFSLRVATLVLTLLCVSGRHDEGYQAEDERQLDTSSLQDSRLDQAANCTAKLSGMPDPLEDPNSPQYKATQYFVGAGQNIEIPSEDQCSWDSEFGQVYALIVLREAVQVREASWFLEPPERRCVWSRVHCDDYGNVVWLSFNNAHIAGALPNELEGLLHLDKLEFYTNSGLTGSLPSQLGALGFLTSLQLHYTSLQGTVPSDLGALSRLRELWLDHTQLTGDMPAEVCALKDDGGLEILTAQCGGDHPPLVCSCCTSCELGDDII